jgi:hypothetical protein
MLYLPVSLDAANGGFDRPPSNGYPRYNLTHRFLLTARLMRYSRPSEPTTFHVAIYLIGVNILIHQGPAVRASDCSYYYPYRTNNLRRLGGSVSGARCFSLPGARGDRTSGRHPMAGLLVTDLPSRPARRQHLGQWRAPTTRALPPGSTRPQRRLRDIGRA